jgi:hypothetical protein
MTDYTDDALDALGIVRLAQNETDPVEMEEQLMSLLDERDTEEMITLIWLLASLIAELTNEWRASVLSIIPEELHASVPTPGALVQEMTDNLLRQELAGV